MTARFSSPRPQHGIENKEYGHLKFVALRMFIMQVLARQFHFLDNRRTELPVPALLWPVNWMNVGGHVARLSGPTVYSLYCGGVFVIALCF